MNDDTEQFDGCELFLKKKKKSYFKQTNRCTEGLEPTEEFKQHLFFMRLNFSDDVVIPGACSNFSWPSLTTS